MIQQQVEKQRRESITLIAPEFPPYHPKIAPTPIPPQIVHAEILRPPARVKPMPVPPPDRTEPKPLPTPDKVIAAAPRVSVPAPREAPVPAPQPVLKPTPTPAPPKPEVRTGTFQTANAAVAQQKAKDIEVGGFGDPNGAVPSVNSRPAPMTMARVGSFDLPQGSGKAGGGGQSAAGGVRQTAFGDGGASSQSNQGNGHNAGGQVHSAGFGDGTNAAGSGSRTNQAQVRTGSFGQTPAPTQTATAQRAKPVQPALTPVEILSKPRPVYTAEARNLKLEGQVALDVIFQSNGSIRIVRVVKGLGHGLDEAAEQAALQVHFRPATRDGVPIDSNATIHITFELS